MTGSKQLAITAARAASDKQAADILVLEVRDLIVITDYFVIASGRSDRQVKTIAESIEEALRGEGEKPLRREGRRDGRWVLLDYLDFVVHVFLDEERDFYGLERLWADAPVIDWNHAAARSGG
ncbi:MAG TPA: ribosome silencing factor [Actinomycetota bacterium]